VHSLMFGIALFPNVRKLKLGWVEFSHIALSGI
jgi:hypothetical protein